MNKKKPIKKYFTDKEAAPKAIKQKKKASKAKITPREAVGWIFPDLDMNPILDEIF